MTTETDDNVAELLPVAEHLAGSLYGDAQAEVLAIIAARYAKNDHLDHAIDLAETIPDPFTRENTFSEIAATAVIKNNTEYADGLLGMIDEPGVRSLATEEVAVKHAELGNVDKALELANDLDDIDPALRRIALAGSVSPRSVEIAQSIVSEDLRASALGQLALAAHRAGQKSEAEDLLAESLSASEAIEFSQNQIYTLIGIASVYEEIGDTDRAVEILSQAFKLSENFEGTPETGMPSSFALGEALTQLVESFARLGRFDLADLAAEQIEDPFQFAHASAKEAMAYFKAGQAEQAMTLLNEALELALGERVYGQQGVLVKDSLLAELAVDFTITGHLEKALQILKKLSTDQQQAMAHQLVGKQCARSGQSSGIFQAAQAITDKIAITSYWLGVTDVLKESNEADLAPQTLLKAAESAATIESNYEKALSLIEAAYRFAITDLPGKASELFNQALVTISQMEPDEKKVLALLRMDERFTQLNRKPDEEERRMLERMYV